MKNTAEIILFSIGILALLLITTGYLVMHAYQPGAAAATPWVYCLVIGFTLTSFLTLFIKIEDVGTFIWGCFGILFASVGAFPWICKLTTSMFHQPLINPNQAANIFIIIVVVIGTLRFSVFLYSISFFAGVASCCKQIRWKNPFTKKIAPAAKT